MRQSPPKAELALVVGVHRVPITSLYQLTQNGEFENHQMVAMDECWSPWLWQSLGLNARDHPRLPLLEEMRQARREYLSRPPPLASYEDEGPREQPRLLPLTLRGREAAREYLRKLDPDFVVMAPPCTEWSQLQNVNQRTRRCGAYEGRGNFNALC